LKKGNENENKVNINIWYRQGEDGRLPRETSVFIYDRGGKYIKI